MIKKITFFPILFITLLFSTQISAEVIVEVGSEPSCQYGYYDYKPYYCAPYGYYVLNGLSMAYLLVPAPGSRALVTFVVM